MLSKATIVSGGNISLNSVVDALVPRRPQHRIVFSVATLCLISLIICITLSIYAQSNQVLLVSSTAAIQQPAATTGTSTSATTAPTNQGAVNVAKTLVRIDQSVPASYDNEQDYTTWWPSSCSAASMTEVINAYLHTHYTISNILAVEAAFQNPAVITADSGLLYPEGIDRTMVHFGFVTTHQHYDLDQLIATANGGTPVLVNFPPATWGGGHFLVVVGGNNQYVHLADSSKLNMQYMARARFEYYWQGFADTFALMPYSVTGRPTVTASFINQVLATYHSPAAGKGQTLYDMGVTYGIDPAFALAFFMHESSFGTSGEAAKTLSLGNSRCMATFPCVDQDRGGYAQFASWEQGFQAWYSLIKQGYVDGGINVALGRDACPCISVQQIIPVYAPSSDNNDERAYIGSLIHALDTWRAGQITV